MTDCFQPLERSNRITYQTIKALNEMGVGYLIVTKNGLVADDDYMEILDPKLAHIQVSITSTDDVISRRTEPGAPLPDVRIATVEKLQKAGFDVAVRLSPFIPEFVDIDRINSIECDKILVEFLRVNTWIRKWITSTGVQVDLTPYTLYNAGYNHLPLERKVELMDGITGFKQVSVCEDVEAHWYYWRDNVNYNAEDCCNLRV